MRKLVFLLALAAGGCGDNLRGEAPADARVDSPAVDGSIDGAPQPLAACLDRPTDLARPPGDQLPCDLLPPDFVAP